MGWGVGESGKCRRSSVVIAGFWACGGSFPLRKTARMRVVSAGVCERFKQVVSWLAVAVVAGFARGDESLYRYEWDVLPLDPSAGWEGFAICDSGCSEWVEGGHLLLSDLS